MSPGWVWATPGLLGLALAGSAAEPAPPPGDASAQSPSWSVEEDGLRLTWFERVGEHRHALKTAVLASQGGWGPASTISESDAFFVNWADTPSVTRGGDGSWLAHYAVKSAPDTYAYDVVVATSPDGVRWAALGPVHDDGTPTEHGFVSTWPTDEGVGLVWLDGRQTAVGGPMTLRAGHVPPISHRARLLDDRVCDCCGTSVAIAPDGVPVVVYRDRTDSEIRDIYAIRLDGSDPVRVAADRWQIAGCPVNGPRAVTVAGAVVVAWATGAGGKTEVRAAASTDGGRTFGPSGVLASGTPAPIGRVDLIPGGDSDLFAIWLHAVGDAEAEVRARRLSLDGGRILAGDPEVVGQAKGSRSAGFPRGALLGDELVTVWSDPDAGLVMARTAVSALRPGRTELAAAGTDAEGGMMGPARLPSLVGTTLDGSPWELAAHAKPTLITLWASWCAPCRRELPALIEASRRPDLDLVVIAVDDRPEVARRALGAVADHLKPVFVGGDLVRRGFGTNSVPTAFLFDAAGGLIWSKDGAIETADLDRALGAGAASP